MLQTHTHTDTHTCKCTHKLLKAEQDIRIGCFNCFSDIALFAVLTCLSSGALYVTWIFQKILEAQKTRKKAVAHRGCIAHYNRQYKGFKRKIQIWYNQYIYAYSVKVCVKLKFYCDRGTKGQVSGSLKSRQFILWVIWISKAIFMEH